MPHVALHARSQFVVLALVTGFLLLSGLVPTWAETEVGDADTDEVVEDPFFADTEERGYDEAVLSLAAQDIIRGCKEDLFCPDRSLTRAQWATMLANALDLEPIAEGPFTDIDGNVHEEAINALSAEGITAGCRVDAYCPDEYLTREQAASLLARGFTVPPAETTHFDDLSATHGDNVDRLASAGIAAGCSDPLNYFCSSDITRRWEAAVFLARTLELIERVEIAPLEERRAEQERIDEQREAAARAQREAEEEARRQAEYEAAAAERLAMWESLAQCESNQNWQANTGNGYYGGLQFLPETWWSVGGQGLPHRASKEEQIYRAERLLEKPWATFSNQWPACSRRLGL